LTVRSALFLLFTALAWQSSVPATAADGTVTASKQAEDEAWKILQASRITTGDRLLTENQPEQAIREAFDPLIADYESRYVGDKITYYSARTSAEGLAYMLHAAAEHNRSGKGKDALLLDHTWAYGYYGKAYALIELDRPDDAMAELEKALKLAPYNPQFLSELGHVYQLRRKWPEMLKSNQSAEEFAQIASPEDRQAIEHARALRGQGFALIELGRLQEAENKFLESLKIDPSSLVARNELDYIQQLRSKAKAASGKTQ
jgi:Flp pilus assembly protein TadD